MTIGFFGTEFGLTPEQIHSVTNLIKKFQPKIARHGASTRGDYAFHHTIKARSHKTSIIVHPDQNSKYTKERGIKEILPEQKLEIRDVNLIQLSDLVCIAGDHPCSLRDYHLNQILKITRTQKKSYCLISPNGATYFN
jgi:hypothetical protein